MPETRSNNGHSSTSTLDDAPRSHLVTGSSDLATAGPAAPLVTRPLLSEKTVVFLRHGQTTWNLEKRIQACPYSLLACSRKLSPPHDACRLH